MKIGVTGTQYGATPEQLDELKHQLHQILKDEAIVLHHGDCVGADYQAATLVGRMPRTHIVAHPPRDNRKRGWHRSHEVRTLKPYLERNKDIVDETVILFALPRSPEAQRSGTWATVRYAVKQGKPVVIIYPSGSIERR